MIKKSILTFGFLLIIYGIKTIQSQQNAPIQLYILMGQSNMAGRGVISAEFKEKGNARVLMFTKDKEWVQAKHPLHFDKPGIAGVGPGLAFGIAMAETDPEIKIGLIPCAVGGTSITQWVPGAYDVATKTHPYDDALTRVKAALNSGMVKGVIWHQGESDSSPEQIALYAEGLKVLIQRIRTEIGKPELPFIIGELGQYRPSYVEMNKELAKIPRLIPYTALVSSAGLTHKGDTTHFDSSSAEEFGKRFAVKMLQVQQTLKKNDQ